MSLTLPETISALAELSPEELHAQNRALRRRLADDEWTLAAHLVVSEDSRLFLAKGCASMAEYGQKCLNLSRHKAVELIRVGRTFAVLPAISEAFRQGKLSWRKVREITRVATPESEGYWLEQALSHDGDTVARMIAMSPREYKRGKALAAATESTQAELFATTEAMEAAHPAAAIQTLGADVNSEEPRSGPPPGTGNTAGTFLGTGAALDSNGGHTEETAVEPVSNAAAESEQRPPHRCDELSWKAPQFVRLTLCLTTEEYGVLEKALSLVRAQTKKRLRREAGLAKVCQAFLSSPSGRGKPRYQVLVHVNAASGEGYVESDRGLLAASSDQVEEAMKSRTVMVTGPEQEVEAEQLTLLAPRSTSRGKRPALPHGLVNALYARAGGRCEKCGDRGGPLMVHHDRHWSKGGRHRLEEVRLLCDPCHRGIHHTDFEKEATWRTAREKAIKGRRSDSGAPEPEP